VAVIATPFPLVSPTYDVARRDVARLPVDDECGEGRVVMVTKRRIVVAAALCGLLAQSVMPPGAASADRLVVRIVGAITGNNARPDAPIQSLPSRLPDSPIVPRLPAILPPATAPATITPTVGVTATSICASPTISTVVPSTSPPSLVVAPSPTPAFPLLGPVPTGGPPTLRLRAAAKGAQIGHGVAYDTSHVAHIHDGQVDPLSCYDRLPLSFERNEGQAGSQVRFISRGVGYTLFLTGSDAVLALSKSRTQVVGGALPSGAARARNKPRRDPRLAGRSSGGAGIPPTSLTESAVWLHIAGANTCPRVIGLDKLPSVANYLIGNNRRRWHTNIPTYARVAYHDVYPGVDLIYYGHQGRLEYDWTLAPGADPRTIALSIRGAQRVRVDRGGALLIQTKNGVLRQDTPVVYQQIAGHRRRVAGGYALARSGRLSFAVGHYDRHRPLTIDPVLSYSTYLGGGGDDHGTGITVDGAGNAYVLGATASSTFPTSTGAAQSAYGGNNDVFVTKLNAAGNGLVYSTYLGGSGDDVGPNGASQSIAVDSGGDAYITGDTLSTDFPTTANAYSRTFAGGGYYGGDAFVSKLNASGSGLLYSTYLGGSGNDYGKGIAVDTYGNAYITGHTSSVDFPTTANALTRTYIGRSEGFVAKVNTNANGSASLAYSTYLAGADQDNNGGYNIALDADNAGNVYVTGDTGSSSFPTTANAYQRTNGGGVCNSASCHDAFLVKLNTVSGVLAYSTYLGGNGDERSFGVATDGVGDAYITGWTLSANFPTTPNALPGGYHGGYDAFVAEFNTNASGSASLAYSTYLGGSGDDEGYSIAADGFGNAYVTGWTSSTDFPTVNPSQAANGGGRDAFVAELNTAAGGASALVYSTYLGGSGGDAGYGVATDGTGSAYVVGDTTSTNFPTTNPTQGASAGGYDAFVAKVSSCPNGGFELPVLGAGGYQYAPSGACWTFATGGGISGNGSGFTGGNPGAPEGRAFIQGAGTLQQTIGGFQAGTAYAVTFAAAQRGNYGTSVEDFQVLLDGALLGTFKPDGTSYAYYSTGAFTAASGMHTLKFVGLDTAGGDNTAFIDNVHLKTSTAPLMTPTPNATATAAAGQTQTAAAGQTQTAGANATASAQPTATSTVAPTGTPIPTTRVPVDDSALGQGPSRFSYTGLGWRHCAGCTPAVGPMGTTAYSNTYSQDNTANDLVTVAFTGTGISLYGVVTLQGGIGTASIVNASGQVEAAETQVHFYPVSTGGVTPTLGGNQLLYSSPPLANGLHVFTLRVTKTHDAGSTDYYVYPDRVDITRSS